MYVILDKNQLCSKRHNILNKIMTHKMISQKF
jgi:hypothetical protein